MDKKMKDTVQNPYHQVYLTDSSPFTSRDNITIMNSYVITTKISEKLASGVDTLYRTISDEVTLEKELNEMFPKAGIIKLTIENNGKKAKMLRKRMSSDFYVSKELQEKFDLY